MDYLWAGVPCVLASGDEIAARFGEADFATLVPPGDVDAAAAAVLALIDDPARRRRAHEAGVGLAEAYRWSTLAKPLAAAIQESRDARQTRPSGKLARAVGTYYVRRTVDRVATAVRSSVSATTLD
jgi:hypothetical protein